jgi:hypothetical protein
MVLEVAMETSHTDDICPVLFCRSLRSISKMSLEVLVFRRAMSWCWYFWIVTGERTGVVLLRDQSEALPKLEESSCWSGSGEVREGGEERRTRRYLDPSPEPLVRPAAV